MICSKCNTMNPEGASFCKNCGASLFNQESVPVAPEEIFEEPLSENPVINAIKKTASSAVFLAGVICITISAVMQLLSAFSGRLMLELVSAFEEAGYTEEVVELLDSIFTGASVLSVIPLALVVVGLWLCHSIGKSQEAKTAGLNIIKGIIIYEIIAMSVAIGLIVILFIVCMAVPSFLATILNGSLETVPYVTDEVGTVVIMAILVLVFISMAVAFVVNYILYAKALKTVKTIKDSLVSGTVAGKISMFLVIMLFVFGGSTAMTFSLSGISLGASYILFGIALAKLRGEFIKLSIEE